MDVGAGKDLSSLSKLKSELPRDDWGGEGGERGGDRTGNAELSSDKCTL